MKLRATLFALAFGLPISVDAQWIGNGVKVARLRTLNSDAFVGTTIQAPNTCSYYGEHIKFDPTTATGKAIMATIMLAKALDKPIEIWYTVSTAPGTTEANGCSPATMAVAFGVGMPAQY
jgi:hypothetical protein